jgi:hypothetical protein
MLHGRGHHTVVSLPLFEPVLWVSFIDEHDIFPFILSFSQHSLITPVCWSSLTDMFKLKALHRLYIEKSVVKGGNFKRIDFKSLIVDKR